VKRLFTSYYAKPGLLPNQKAVAVSVAVPHWLRHLGIRHCPELAPSPKLLQDFKEGRCDEQEYKVRYLYGLALRGKTPQQVADSLPEGSVLLCYEKSGKFCHRHLAARWLESGADVAVEELQ
jgi:uncharacterized protein YeaO (DUF488 family)